jgi:hypothetical protein
LKPTKGFTSTFHFGAIKAKKKITEKKRDPKEKRHKEKKKKYIEINRIIRIELKQRG